MQQVLQVHENIMVSKPVLGLFFWVTLGTLCFQDLLEGVSGAIHGGLASQGLDQSINDANLMFESLLRGIKIDKDNNIYLLDLEMASMRQGRAFLARINDNIPKTLPSMDQMVKALEDQTLTLRLAASQFESLVLGMVYSAHQAKLQERDEDQEKWSDVMFRLANITISELRRPDPITTNI
ncbi:protein FAM180A [Esox lucius]|uniref:protein FAM180A n=1 Tax=Esox lucius TaxID=8010 RepID=UPI000575F2C2|nr:protein FAM180A [Esox lucius]